MKNLEILKEDEINNYNEEDVFKAYESFNFLYSYSLFNEVGVIRSIYIKVGNIYRVYDEKYVINNNNFADLYGKLLNIYSDLKINDEKFKKLLKSMALQKTFYDEYENVNDELTSRDLYFLFKDKKDGRKFNSLSDYYKYFYRENHMTSFTPAWNTLGYAIQKSKMKVKKI